MNDCMENYFKKNLSVTINLITLFRRKKYHYLDAMYTYIVSLIETKSSWQLSSKKRESGYHLTLFSKSACVRVRNIQHFINQSYIHI